MSPPPDSTNQVSIWSITHRKGPVPQPQATVSTTIGEETGPPLPPQVPSIKTDEIIGLSDHYVWGSRSPHQIQHSGFLYWFCCLTHEIVLLMVMLVVTLLLMALTSTARTTLKHSLGQVRTKRTAESCFHGLTCQEQSSLPCVGYRTVMFHHISSSA